MRTNYLGAPPSPTPTPLKGVCSNAEILPHLLLVTPAPLNLTTGEKPASSASLSLSVSASGSSLPEGAFFPCRSREARGAGYSPSRDSSGGQPWPRDWRASKFQGVPPALQEPLTPLVVFVMQGISFCLHAVVQLHEQGLKASVHPLDQLMINHQGPQQDTQH